MDITIILIIIIIIICLYLYLYATNIPKNYPPGPKPFPIWGGYSQILIENFKFPYKAINNMSKRYKTNVLGTYFGLLPTVIACDMETIRDVLTRPEFQGRPDGFFPRYRSYGELLGIIFSEGHLWEEQRRFMLRNMRDFGYGKRNDLLEGKYLEYIQDLIAILNKNDQPFAKDGLVMVPEVFYATLANMVLQVFSGNQKPLNEGYKFTKEMVKMVRALDATTGAINMTPWMRHFAPGATGFTAIKDVNSYLQTFVQDLITEHTDKMTDDTANDFIDRYISEMRNRKGLETETTFSEKQLQLVGMDMLFTGTVTITFMLGFIILLLAKHRNVQEKCQKEIDDIVGRNRLPTLTDRRRMPFTEAVIRESLRYQTLLPLGLPHKASQDTTLGGYFIPRGTMVMTSLYSMHRDEKIWDKPDKFIPDRFIDSDGKLIKHDPSLPFGIGKRVCPGETFARQNMFMIISGLLQNFNFTQPDNIKLPDFSENISAINESPKPFLVKVTPRL